MRSPTAAQAVLLSWSSTLPAVISQDPLTNAETALNALQTWYNQTSGIWDTCGWWNGANCMTVLADLAAVDSSVVSTAQSVFSNTYAVAPSVNPAPGVEKVDQGGEEITVYPASWEHQPKRKHPKVLDSSDPSVWLDGYYDDDSWWALAWIAAYDVTQNADYLSLAEGIFDATTKGWPTNCSNGGIWWNSNHTYANAIANELFLSTAAHLANRADDKDYYVNWAQMEWDWFQNSGMINDQSLINDGLDGNCANNGQTVWSYNQGVILGGLVELNKASPNSDYITAATNIANAAIANLTDENKVLHDPCEPDCAPDATQFKGIFIRNLLLLQSVAPSDDYIAVIQASADSIWNNDRNSDNMLSVDWAGPFIDPVNASTHSSAMDALVAAIVVQ